jgi:hypothetical protein
MKKIVSLALAAGVIAALPGAAVAGKKAAHQHVQGNIAMQAPPSDATDNPNGCYSGVHRRLSVLTSGAANGIVGFDFDVDPATWNKKFKLTPDTAGVDIDITFYAEFGTQEQAAEPSFAPANFSYETRNEAGEKGKIPAKMTKAIVCMKAGQNADFTYTGGAGVK